ncbi:unnamed protein product [Gordionus sp. m RMFG-2023]
MIRLDDGLAIQVFWNSTVDRENSTGNTLFCVSMESTYPGNFSKKAMIEETSHIFQNVKLKIEYRISISVCSLDPKNNKYNTNHQVYVTVP